MNKTWFCLILVLLSVTSTFSQNISKTWTLDQEKGNPDQEIFADGNTLSLNEGLFSISKAKDTLAKGDYIFQNKLLVLFYNTPQDSIVNYRVSTLTDSSMAINQANREFHFKAEAFNDPEEVIPAPIVKEMIPSAGISFSSIWRGALGMSTLLLIAFLFSSNRKAINWKTIGIGLSAQLLLAIGV